MVTREVNPNAILLIGICTVIGALLGSWLTGLSIGLAIVLIATLMAE